MNQHVELKSVIGLLAIVVGAVATLDTTFAPYVRYMAIYLSLLVIAMTLLHTVYVVTDDNIKSDVLKDKL